MLRAVLTTHKEKDKMNPEQQQAILTIALLAAFADGINDDREREEIRRLAESLGSEPGAPNLAGLYREVLLKRVDLRRRRQHDRGRTPVPHGTFPDAEP
jgi:hypothetical protein